MNFTNSKAGLFKGRWDPGRRGNSTLGSVFEDRSPDKVCCIFCVTLHKKQWYSFIEKWIMCTKCFCSRVSINALDQYPGSTLDGHLNQHFSWHSINISVNWSIEQSVKSRLIYCRLLMECQPSIDRDVHQVSIDTMDAFSTHDPEKLH